VAPQVARWPRLLPAVTFAVLCPSSWLAPTNGITQRVRGPVERHRDRNVCGLQIGNGLLDGLVGIFDRRDVRHGLLAPSRVDGRSNHAYYAKHGLVANHLLKNEGLMILEKAVPPKLANETKRIALVVDKEWLKRIGEWRRLQDDFPTLSDSIRRLVDQALEAVPVPLIKKIDAWRARQPGAPNMIQATRMLIEMALDADASGKKKPKS
jgi:hypothetical protein